MLDLPIQILTALESASSLPIASSENFPDIDPLNVKSALDSLQAKEMITYETLETEEAILTEEAEGIVKDGSHEAKVYDAVCKELEGLKISELPKIVGAASAKVGQGKAFKEGWIKKNGDRLVKAVRAFYVLTLFLALFFSQPNQRSYSGKHQGRNKYDEVDTNNDQLTS